MMTYLAIGWLVCVSRIFMMPSSGTEKMAPIRPHMADQITRAARMESGVTAIGAETTLCVRHRGGVGGY